MSKTIHLIQVRHFHVFSLFWFGIKKIPCNLVRNLPDIPAYFLVLHTAWRSLEFISYRTQKKYDITRVYLEKKKGYKVDGQNSSAHMADCCCYFTSWPLVRENNCQKRVVTDKKLRLILRSARALRWMFIFSLGRNNDFSFLGSF